MRPIFKAFLARVFRLFQAFKIVFNRKLIKGSIGHFTKLADDNYDVDDVEYLFLLVFY